MERVKSIRKLLDDNGATKEPIIIAAHSQGTMITLAALSKGMKINGAIFLHSPLKKTAGAEERRNLETAFSNIGKGRIVYAYDTIDQVTTMVNKFPKGSNGVPDLIKDMRDKDKAFTLERQTPATLFDHIPLLRFIGRGVANHATMTLPSYGYQALAKVEGVDELVDFGYGLLTAAKNGLDLYKNEKILQGLGTYYKFEDIKYLKENKDLGIWTVPK